MTCTYSLGMLRAQTGRTVLSVGGIALCVVLMLFLLGVYRGVSLGSLEYVHRNSVDLWVLQKNATNILRCTSVLLPAHGDALRRVPGVDSAAPVLLLLATVGERAEAATVYLAGYDPKTGRGGPPLLLKGRSPMTDDEIVFDHAFALKHGYKIGDSIHLQGQILNLVGMSGGTNAFVIQYAFVTIACAQRLIGFPGLVTCFLVTVKGAEPETVQAAIKAALPSVEVFDQATFVANNTRELQTGFLTFIYTIAAMGLVVLTTILSLLLSIHILERRREFAVMKVVGASHRFLSGLVVKQALLISGLGMGSALVLFVPVTWLVEWLAPEVAVATSVSQAIAVGGLVAVVGLASAALALGRLRRIYAMEAFS
jgi:putative ABC transport system permease protein